MTNRLSPILTSSSPSVITDEITRLSLLYQKEFKRALPIDLLHFSSWGGLRKGENSLYGISLYWEDGQEKVAEWARKNVVKSEEASV